MPEFYFKLLFNLLMMVIVTIALQLIRNYSRRIQNENTKELSDVEVSPPSLRKPFIIAICATLAELGTLAIIVSLLSHWHQAPRCQEAAWIVLSISVLVILISRIPIPRPKNVSIVLFAVPNIFTVILMSIFLSFGTPNHFKYVIPIAFAVTTMLPTCAYVLACSPYVNKNKK